MMKIRSRLFLYYRIRVRAVDALLLCLMIAVFPDVSAGDRGIEMARLSEGNNELAVSDIYRRKYALVIGIDDYSDDEIPDLQYAENDSDEIVRVLKNLGFKGKNIVYLKGGKATKKNILSIIRKLKKELSHNDGVFVFFAGHGVYARTKNARGEMVEQGFLLPVDAVGNRASRTGISMSLLSDLLSDLPAKHVLLTIDACYSGFALKRSLKADGFIRKIASKRSRYVITAGGKNEQVTEAAGHGIFTEKLLEGMSGLADVDLDGYITASELGVYLRSTVSRLSDNSQTPIFGVLEGEGEFIFEVSRYNPTYHKSVRSVLVNQNLYSKAYEEGIRLLKSGKLVEAKAKFQEVLKIRPGDYWAMHKIKYIDAYRPYKKKVTFLKNNPFVFIAGDSFIMGQDFGAFENEKPKRMEIVSDYYISKYEITLMDYLEYMKRVGDSVEVPLLLDMQMEGADMNVPVQGVSWVGAKRFCKYYGGRLPTEKEWEYAARGSDGKRFIGGDNFAKNQINWSKDSLSVGVSRVGSFQGDVSEFGIYDLAGNVQEWVADIDKGYLLQEIPMDREGTLFKVVRGGSYKTNSVNLTRLSVRSFRHPREQYIGVGFRCSRTPGNSDYE